MAVADNIAKAAPAPEQPAVLATAEPADFQGGHVVTIAAGHFIHDCYTAFLAPMLIVFRQTMGLSNEAAGLLSVITQQGSLIQPLIGGAADRYGARWFVILAPAVTGAMMSMLGLVTSYWTLAVFLAVVGLSSACLHAVGPVMIGKLSGKRLGTGMSIWMVGGEAGRFIGPLVLAAALPLLTMKHTPWLMIGGLVTGLLLFFMMTDVAKATPHSVTATPSFWHEIRGREKLVAILISVIALTVFVSAALSTYLPLLLSGEGESFQLATISFSIYQAAGVVGAFLGGTLSDRLGRRMMLLCAMLPASLFMFVFLAVLTGPESLMWARFATLLVIGFAQLSVTPVVMALVQESFPGNRALANGFYMALSFLARSAFTLVLGWVGDRYGLRTSFVISAVIPLLGLPVLMFLPNKPPAPRRSAA
jgi:FSR family fosmidomycin resistance protein-like MFS transporter